MTIETIETIEGNLRAVSRLEKGTFQHWDELSRDHTADPSLGDKAYWVADYSQYGRNGSEARLYLARLDHNLVLKHLFDEENSSWGQLLNPRTGYFFRPAQDEAHSVVEASSTLPVPLRALRLQGDDKHYRFLQVRTEDGFINTSTDPEKPHFENPIDEEQQLSERAGYTSAFLNTIRNSREHIQTIKLYVLNPDFAFQAVAEGPIARAARASYFDNYFNFNTISHFVDDHCALRGVPLVIAPQERAEQGIVPSVPPEKPIMDYESAFRMVVENPQKLSRRKVVKLIQVVIDFLEQ